MDMASVRCGPTFCEKTFWHCGNQLPVEPLLNALNNKSFEGNSWVSSCGSGTTTEIAHEWVHKNAYRREGSADARQIELWAFSRQGWGGGRQRVQGGAGSGRSGASGGVALQGGEQGGPPAGAVLRHPQADAVPRRAARQLVQRRRHCAPHEGHALVHAAVHRHAAAAHAAEPLGNRQPKGRRGMRGGGEGNVGNLQKIAGKSASKPTN